MDLSITAVRLPRTPHPGLVNRGHIPSSPASNQNTIKAFMRRYSGVEEDREQCGNKREIAGQIIEFSWVGRVGGWGVGVGGWGVLSGPANSRWITAGGQ